MVLYTYKEALERFGSRAEMSKRLEAGELFRPAHNLYSTEDYSDPLAVAMKRYPQGIVTALTAFFIHGLTDRVPDKIDLATRRNATRISDAEIRQHFVAERLFRIGMSTVEHDGVQVRIYDLESMLFYLVHHDGKLPFDLFKEVLKSYRARAGELDYRKLQEYSAVQPGGRRNLERIIKDVL
jgi:predicted transcriptional regulator of viral defense system